NSWSSGPSMLSSGGSPAGVVVNNALFVFGIGGNGTGTHMFRPTSPDPNMPSGWTALGPMLTGRGGSGVAAVGDVAYVIGGLVAPNGSPSSNVVEAFSTPPPSDFTVSSGNNNGGGGGGGNPLPVVSFQSSDPAIASITPSGFATANAGGQATITATANGISCADAGGACATLTVTPPAFITFTLAPGSAAVPSVTVTAGSESFDVPIGVTQTVDDPGAMTLQFSRPGYTVTPDHADLDLQPGDNITIPLSFALPTISVNNVSVAEGNAGTSNAMFTVALSNPSALTVTVSYATADGTATTADNDYQATSGTLTFAPGETTKT